MNWKLALCVLLVNIIHSYFFQKNNDPVPDAWPYSEIDQKFEGTWKKTPGKKNEGLTKNSGNFSMEFSHDSLEIFILTLTLRNG